MNLWGIIKGLLVQDETDRSKEMSLEVDPAATTATRTTLKAAQTANRTLSLPDATDTLVGKATTDVLTNKSFDADGAGNNLSNVDDSNIKALAGIDASKLADGSVSNAEYQFINSLNSNAQDQLDQNALDIANHISDASDAHDASAISSVPSGNLAATDVQGALDELQSDLDSRATTASNIGTGAGEVFKQKTGSTLELRTIKAGTNITVTNNADDITIDASGGGGGEVNTASNVGAGVGVFKQKTGVDLEFKSLTNGTNISITGNANDVSIATSAEANTASNVGTGEGTIFKQKTGVDLEFKSLKQGTNVTLTNNADDVTIAVASTPTTGSFANVGLAGRNNTATPNTQYDFSATSVTLRNSSNETVTVFNTGTVTNDINVSGPTANGRDSAVAPSNQWRHLYWIWNGSTLATINSTVAPPTGPTLPSGYTHWCYIGALYFSSAYYRSILQGSWVYSGNISDFNLGTLTATSPTNHSLNAVVPPNALSYGINYLGIITSTAGGLVEMRLNVYDPIVTANIIYQMDGLLSGLAASSLTYPFTGQATLPAVLSGGDVVFRYALLVSSGTTPGIGVKISGYQIPNSAE